MNPETVKQFLAWVAPPRHEIIQGGLLPEGQIMFLYGGYSTWKSWLAMELAQSISTGEDWLIYGTEPHNVMILNCEIPKAEYQLRWKDYYAKRKFSSNGKSGKSATLLVDSDMELALDTFTGLSTILQWLKHYKIKVLIVDNVYTAMNGDLTRNTDANIFIRNCKRLQMAGIAIIFVHHARQAVYDNARGGFVRLRGYEMFGSSFLTNWADTIMEVVNVELPGYPDTVKITPQKHRLSALIPMSATLQFVRRTTDFQLLR
tara:strand:+ start:2083 stop:2862 length:780 start_codon:yes stop_codon:yes gene_type:complete